MAVTVKACFTYPDGDIEVRRFPLDDFGKDFLKLQYKMEKIFSKNESVDLHLTWKDEENDHVTFSNDEEFRTALRGGVREGIFRIYAKGVEASDSFRDVEHPGVICDACGKHVAGIRYKCVVCPDFDLCMGCQQQGHHANHEMIRLCRPQAEPCWFEHDQPGGPSAGEEDAFPLWIKDLLDNGTAFSGTGQNWNLPPWIKETLECLKDPKSNSIPEVCPEWVQKILAGLVSGCRQRQRGEESNLDNRAQTLGEQPLQQDSRNNRHCDGDKSDEPSEKTAKIEEDTTTNGVTAPSTADVITNLFQMMGFLDNQADPRRSPGSQNKPADEPTGATPQQTSSDVKPERPNCTSSEEKGNGGLTDRRTIIQEERQRRSPPSYRAVLSASNGKAGRADGQKDGQDVPVVGNDDYQYADGKVELKLTSSGGCDVSCSGVDTLKTQSEHSRLYPTLPPDEKYFHPDPKVSKSLHEMLGMGFSNAGGWLSRLLEAKGGDITQVLDVLHPSRT